MEHDLHRPLPVAHVDEQHTAVVPPVCHPAAQRDLGSGVLGAELAAAMGPHGLAVHEVTAPAPLLTQVATSDRFTVSCSPSTILFSVVTPSASSCSPMIAVYAAPERSACLNWAFRGRSSSDISAGS